MITRPTNFQAFQDRGGDEFHFVVVVSGFPSVMFSDIDMSLTDGQVFGLLKPGMNASQGIDFHSRRSSVGNVTVSISNQVFDSQGEKPGDLWSTVWNYAFTTAGDVDIYLLAGPGSLISSLADGIKVFAGKLTKRPTVNEDTLTIEAEDIGATLLRKKMAPYRVADLDPIWEGSVDGDFRPALVNGDWRNLDFWGAGGYMVKGNMTDKQIVAGHVVDQVAELWLYFDKLDLWVQVDMTTGTGGFTTFNSWYGGSSQQITLLQRPFSGTVSGWAYVSPFGLDDRLWQGLADRTLYNDGRNNVLDEDNAWDRDNETAARLFTGNFDLYTLAMATFGFPDVDADPAEFTIDSTDVRIYWRSLVNPNMGYTYGAPGGFIRTLISAEYEGSTNLTAGVTTIHDGGIKFMNLHIGSGDWDDFATKVGWELSTNRFLIRMPVFIATPGNYAQAEEALNIYQVQLRLRTTLPNDWKQLRPWFVVVGQQVGSEIAARQPSLGAGDPVVSPAYQVELLMRRQFNLTDVNIDVTSFDDAWRSRFNTRTLINDGSPLTLDQFLQELSENANFVVFFNVSGKVRLVSFDSAPATSDAVIHWDDLESLKYSETEPSKVITDLASSWEKNPGTGRYNSTELRINWAAHNLYGIKEAAANFDYYTNQQIGWELQDALMGQASSFFARVHGIATWTPKGIRHAHFEPGDVVEFDAPSCDPQVKRLGRSWSGVRFIITNKATTTNGQQFAAIEV